MGVAVLNHSPSTTCNSPNPAKTSWLRFIGWRAVYLNARHDLERVAQRVADLMGRLAIRIQQPAAYAGGPAPQPYGQRVAAGGRIRFDAGGDLVDHGYAQRPTGGGIEQRRVGLIALAPQLAVRAINVDEDACRGLPGRSP